MSPGKSTEQGSLQVRTAGWTALLSLLACWAGPVLGAEALGLDELSTLLHRDQAATVRYREEQHRAVLKVPLERTGELHFAPPALFEKRVLTPVTETYRLEGDTLTIVLPERRARQISLRNQPLLGGLLKGFKAVVSGDLATLTPDFTSMVTGTAENWTLALRPVQPEVARYIESIEVLGSGSEPRRFTVVERNGDRTVTEVVAPSTPPQTTR